MEFFETSGRNLLAAEAAAGVKHHVALSVVGSERLPDSGYLRAKLAQENLIKASKIPVYVLPLDAVLRICEQHCPVGQRWTDGSLVTGPPAARHVG